MIFPPSPRPQAELRLFCLPYAGGSSSTFMRWQARLDSRVELVCIDPPGRGAAANTQAIDRIDVLADALCAQLLPWLDRPFALFGHSNGALLAFELVRRLEARGHVPRLFFASAKAAPSRVEGEALMHQLPDADFLDELRRMGGTSEMFFQCQEMQRMFLPTIRADFALSETYQYRASAPLATQAVLLGGTLDDCMDQADHLAWAAEFSEPVRSHRIHGGHFFINERTTAVLGILDAELKLCVETQLQT